MVLRFPRYTIPLITHKNCNHFRRQFVWISQRLTLNSKSCEVSGKRSAKCAQRENTIVTSHGFHVTRAQSFMRFDYACAKVKFKNDPERKKSFRGFIHFLLRLSLYFSLIFSFLFLREDLSRKRKVRWVV